MNPLDQLLTPASSTMASRSNIQFSPYREFKREEWAKLRADTPMTLVPRDLEQLSGVIEELSMLEVEQIYLPLSRLLNLHVAAAQELHAVVGDPPGGLVGVRRRRQERGGDHDHRATRNRPHAHCQLPRCQLPTRQLPTGLRSPTERAGPAGGSGWARAWLGNACGPDRWPANLVRLYGGNREFA